MVGIRGGVSSVGATQAPAGAHRIRGRRGRARARLAEFCSWDVSGVHAADRPIDGLAFPGPTSSSGSPTFPLDTNLVLASNRWLMFCLGSVLAISACAGDPGDDQGRASVVLFERAVTCEVPAPGFVRSPGAEIEQRLIVVGGSLRGAHTARSNETTWDGEDEVWLPTVIEGPGLEQMDDVGEYLYGALIARLNEPTLHETTWGGGDRVWFLAAEIEGPGFEGPGDVAVWATAGNRRPIEGSREPPRPCVLHLGPRLPGYALDYEEDALTAAVARCVPRRCSLRTSDRSR